MVRIMMAALALGLVSPAAADPVFVHAQEAELREAPGFDAPVVTGLERGAEVERLARQGRWLRVRSGEREGWVFRFLTGPRPPMAKQSVLDESSPELGDQTRRRASEVTTAGAARGLTAEERRRLSRQGAADYEALDRLEGLDIPPEDVRAFAREDG